MRTCASLIWLSTTTLPLAGCVMCSMDGAPAEIRPVNPAVATTWLFALSSTHVPDRSGACAVRAAVANIASTTLRNNIITGLPG